MKTIILPIIILGLIHTTAMAGATWTREDVWLESAWQALNVIDWGQTRYVSESADYQEVNPILGRDPTRRSVDVFFVAAAALHWAISDRVDAHDRLRWQWISLGAKGAGVWRNWAVGVGLKF